MSDRMGVEFQDVSKRFGSRTVLEQVSFQVPAGEALCILGRSGTGKSVTLKLMIGLLKPDSGNVMVGEESIAAFGEDDMSRIRRNMGFLFQSAALFDSFSVGDNLALPLARFSQNKSAAEIEQIVKERLSQVGLEGEAAKKPQDLSGGMKKRAGLARAMVLDPKVLLVDEPSSGLDRITASEIDDLLLKVKAESKTTMVIVTHDVRGARRLADRIVVLDQGRVVGYGKVAELETSENKVVRELISEN